MSGDVYDLDQQVVYQIPVSAIERVTIAADKIWESAIFAMAPPRAAERPV